MFRAAIGVAMVLVPVVAWADVGGMSVEEASGNWAAARHSQNDIQADVCLAASDDGAMIIRVSKEDVELRTADDSWALPTDASGDLTITVGSVSKTFHMLEFDPNTLATVVSAEDLSPLLDAMDKASTATLQFGTKTTRKVSLAGSTAAINALKSCAAEAGFADLGASSGKVQSPF